MLSLVEGIFHQLPLLKKKNYINPPTHRYANNYFEIVTHDTALIKSIDSAQSHTYKVKLRGRFLSISKAVRSCSFHCLISQLVAGWVISREIPSLVFIIVRILRKIKRFPFPQKKNPPPLPRPSPRPPPPQILSQNSNS